MYLIIVKSGDITRYFSLSSRNRAIALAGHAHMIKGWQTAVFSPSNSLIIRFGVSVEGGRIIEANL